MKNNPQQPESTKLSLFIGIDWADQEHEAYVIDRDGNGNRETIEQSPEGIDAWVHQKLQQANGGPIGIILEQSRGALIHALMFRENVILFPINPKQLAKYRESYNNAGCKADQSDAWFLARMLCERQTILKAWQPDDENTRLLAQLCKTRRKLVDQRTKLNQQLIDLLKACYPLMLDLKLKQPLMLEILRRWPDPRQLKRADRRILHRVFQAFEFGSQIQREELIVRIRSAKLLSSDRALLEPAAVMLRAFAKQISVIQQAIDELDASIETEMNKHPDAPLFKTLPGAGKALAPRLLTAFGSQRDRFDRADDVTTLSGIAPVTKQSGKSRVVHRRYACPKYLRQTFHEFADHARKWCPWSRAYYQLQRSRNMKHHAAIRKLARQWIRILFRVWKDRKPYDAAAYLANIVTKNPEIIPFLDPSKT